MTTDTRNFKHLCQYDLHRLEIYGFDESVRTLFENTNQGEVSVNPFKTAIYVGNLGAWRYFR